MSKSHDIFLYKISKGYSTTLFIFRGYCSRRVKRIRKSLHFPQGDKRRVHPKKIDIESIKDVRYRVYIAVFPIVYSNSQYKTLYHRYIHYKSLVLEINHLIRKDMPVCFLGYLACISLTSLWACDWIHTWLLVKCWW